MPASSWASLTEATRRHPTATKGRGPPRNSRADDSPCHCWKPPEPPPHPPSRPGSVGSVGSVGSAGFLGWPDSPGSRRDRDHSSWSPPAGTRSTPECLRTEACRRYGRRAKAPPHRLWLEGIEGLEGLEGLEGPWFEALSSRVRPGSSRSLARRWPPPMAPKGRPSRRRRHCHGPRGPAKSRPSTPRGRQEQWPEGPPTPSASA